MKEDNYINEIPAKALEIKSCGYNCAQAVMGALAPLVDMDRVYAMRITAAFGGGLKHKQLCGAVAAGLALSLRYGSPDTGKEKNAVLDKCVTGFVNEFLARNGTTVCGELLLSKLEVFDFSQPVRSESNDDANPYNIYAPVCGKAITDAADIVVKIIDSGC